MEIDRVTRRYGPVMAVQNLSLAVAEGELVGLLGPSGAGKSTLLRLIAGFEGPDEGSILLGGRLVSSPGRVEPPERRGVGMVFQDYALFPHLTVEENVAFGLRRMGRAERRSRVRAVLQLVGLAGREGRYPHQLSGGQQQRVALARALAPQPSVILLDEPFSNLDAVLRAQMRAEVQEILRRAGATGILVTHDYRDAFAICDRVGVLHQGRLEQVGTPEELFHRPATPFVASFVAQATLLRGRVVANGQLCVATPLGNLPCPFQCPVGREVTVCLRPDCLKLDARGPLYGRVLGVVYQGTELEVTVGVPGRDPAAGETVLRLRADPSLRLKVGDSIRFRVAPEAVSVLN